MDRPAEVSYLNIATNVQKKVFGFDVPVDHLCSEVEVNNVVVL